MFTAYAVVMIIGAVLLLSAAGIIIGLSRILIVALRLASQGVETAGSVIGTEDGLPGGDGNVCVSYKAPGGTFEASGNSRLPRTGQALRVRYHKANPELAMVWPQRWQWAASYLPAALVTAVLAIGLVTGSSWYFTGTHHRLQLPITAGSFILGIALICGYYAATRYSILLHWRRMVRTDGMALRFNERSPVGEGVLVSFHSSEGNEKFWARAGSANIDAGDNVTVYYDPSAPATSATVETVGAIRAYAIFSTILTLGFGALSLYELLTAL